MPKIIIQAGHEGRTSGSTGAPGEQGFNVDVANKVADQLRAKNFEVRRVNADPKDSEIAGDWDLFLSIHYDADVYNDDGGFVDYPEPSTDGVTNRSQEIARFLTETYFPATGIKNMPGRSNRNTRYYYMWKRLSLNTPCVIIECGVGNRSPKDHETLFSRRDVVVQAITNGILKSFGLPGDIMANMYKGYDLANPDSMKVAVDILVDVMGGKYIKVEDAEVKLNEEVNRVRTEYEKTITELKIKADNLLDSITAVRLLLELPETASSDELLGKVKGLIDEVKLLKDQLGTPTTGLPQTYNGKEVVGVIIKP